MNKYYLFLIIACCISAAVSTWLFFDFGIAEGGTFVAKLEAAPTEEGNALIISPDIENKVMLETADGRIAFTEFTSDPSGEFIKNYIQPPRYWCETKVSGNRITCQPQDDCQKCDNPSWNFDENYDPALIIVRCSCSQ